MYFDPLGMPITLAQKFNPHHDAQGRFSAGDADSVIFGSPNRHTGLSLGQALQQMDSTAMGNYIEGSQRFNKQFGIQGVYQRGIGLWEGSVEATVLEHIAGKPDMKALTAAAAAQGKEQGQNAMATWVDDPDGPHTITAIALPKAIDVTPQFLIDNGVPAATITADTKGTVISVISTEPNEPEMVALAKKLGSTEIEVSHGHANFIDKADYDAIISGYRSNGQKRNGRKGDGGQDTSVAHRAKRLGSFSYR